MPGGLKSFLNFSTSGVITPRSSAIIGKNSDPKSFFILFNSALPGEFIHLPQIADQNYH